MNLQEIERQAREELAQEDFIARVEARAAVLRARRDAPWWRKVLPFKVTWTGWSAEDV